MTPIVAVLAAVLVAAASVAPARGDTDRDAGSEPAAWRLSMAPAAGVLFLDGELGDYRWDTRPAFQPGVSAALHHGRFAAGVSAAWSATSQSTGVPGEDTVPRVHATEVALVLEGRLARVGGVELRASGHGGRLYLGYEPASLVIDVPGAATPLTVDFDPVTEWCYGFGTEIRRALTERMALGLQVRANSFAIDTAHRSGDEIVESRERFTNWTVALAVLGFADID